jgi:type IV pilus assembly protein PilB
MSHVIQAAPSTPDARVVASLSCVTLFWMSSKASARIGELLVSAGLLSRIALDQALQEQETVGGRLGEILVRRGCIHEHDLTQILSNRASVAWVSLDYVDFTRELLSLVPAELAQELNLIPVFFRIERTKEKILYIAVDDPTNISAMEKVALHTGMHVRPLLAPASEIRRTVRQYYFGEEPRE